MKRKLIYHLLILFLFIIFLSNNKISGQILYHDFIPNEVIQVLEPGGESFSFDINQDGVDDLIIIANSWFTPIHQNCCWNYTIRLYTLSNIQIGHKDTSNIFNYVCNTAYLPFGVLINDRFEWVEDYSGLLAEGPYAGGPCVIPETAHYYPIKMVVNDSSYLYGWIRLSADFFSVTLYDMAINLDTNNYINAGQIITSSQEFANSVTPYRLYHNQAKGHFIISLSDINLIQNKTTIRLFNIQGQIVYYNKFNPNTKDIIVNQGHLPKGFYICIISIGDINFTEKIIFK